MKSYRKELWFTVPNRRGFVNITPEVARNAVRNLTQSYTQGIPYWGNGQIHLDGMKRIIEVQKSVGALEGDIDVTKMIDTQFLPEDIRKPVAGK